MCSEALQLAHQVPCVAMHSKTFVWYAASSLGLVFVGMNLPFTIMEFVVTRFSEAALSFTEIFAKNSMSFLALAQFLVATVLSIIGQTYAEVSFRTSSIGSIF